MYYYTNGRPEHEIIKGIESHSTIFKAREGESIVAEKSSYRAKDLVKDLTPPIFIKVLKKLK